MSLAEDLRKITLGTALCLGLTFGNAAAVEAANQTPPTHRQMTAQERTESASGFIASMGQEAIDFLGNSKLSIEQKRQKFSDLLDRDFDMKSIGRFCLGSNWKKLNEEEQAEYQTLFKQLIVRTYSSKFSDYKGYKFEVGGTQDMPNGDIIVQSLIFPADSQNIPVDWQVRWKNEQYKIMDVKIEGVSMSITKKSEFSSYIQKHGGNPKVIIKGLQDNQLDLNGEPRSTAGK